MSFCPSDETLARLGHDSLDGALWAAVEAHVQHCEKCVGMLEKLVSHNTATAARPASLPAEESLPRIPGFDIECELGRGSMGVVYRAWEPKLARSVALKIVPSGPLTGARERKRWLSEARCITRVCHPNVVQIHDAAEADGWLYLVLEFVPGGSLKERLRDPVPPRAAAELIKPVAAAMSAVHAAGLLHLDLKPSNILLDCAPEAPWKQLAPKVADFGIARPLADLDASSTSLAGPWGTPAYMAPEQIAADRAALGPATDVYALGAILYELLTGRPPFLAASPIKTFEQIRDAKPVAPHNLNPSVPRDLDTVCLRCLHKDHRKRYPSAEALADDLNRFLQGRPITARPISPTEHAWRWCRRQPLITTLAATLILTVLASFLGLPALLRHSETQRARSQANYQVASRSLDELTRILSDELMNDPLAHEGPNSRKTLEIARAQQIELSKTYPLDIGGVKRLATFSVLLALFYSRDGKRDEARSLIQEAIAHSDAYLAKSPGDADLEHRLFELFACMLSDLAGSDNDRFYEHYNARAIALLERLKPVADTHVADMSQLSSYHRLRADYLLMSGQTDRARQELEQDIALFRSVPAAETLFPEFVWSEALTLAKLARWSGEFPQVRSPNLPRPASAATQNPELELAELTALRIGWLPSTIKSALLIPEDLPAEAWSDRVISTIKSDAKMFDLDHTRIPAVGWTMRPLGFNMLARQRAAGKLGDAHRRADQLVALAERLTRSYPDQAAAYMLLSEGYVQKAKNAYRQDEAPVIERWLRKASGAAIQAAALEPENGQARNLVRDRRASLNKLASN